VVEDNVRTFTTNWTGTGVIDGSGDTEKVTLDSAEYMESEVVIISAASIVRLRQNVYGTGDVGIIKYRTVSNYDNIFSEPWTVYTVPFASAGYVQVRVEAP
jgi:hypothetical protein